MSGLVGFLRTNPTVGVVLAALGIVTLVFTILAIMMSRAGASLRPLVFLAVFLGIVGGPQLAFHLGQALGWIPTRNLIWVAGGGLPAHGYVENEGGLHVEDGRFSNPLAVFGSDADPDLLTDLRRLGPDGPAGNAEAAQMVVRRSGGTTLVARYPDGPSALAAAERYLTLSVGHAPPPGADGVVTVTRPAGDVLKLLVVGRTLLAFSGADAQAARAALESSGALVTATEPEYEPEGTGPGEYWLYRPAVLAGLIALLLALATLWFFKGSSWAASVPAVAGVPPAPAGELRQRLLAVNGLDVPFTVEEESPGGRIVVTWRFADARWVDLARAHGMRRTHRLLLELDEPRRVVRPTEQYSALDWSAGPRGAGVQWRTGMGITFFQVEHQRVFGLQVDGQGRLVPQLSYAYTFNLQEMKSPFIAATTAAGWTWRPTAWHGPSWLRWLTH